MGKRKLSDKIFGESPWDVEVELSPGDLDPTTARARVINRYMHNGDLRPLAAAIKEGRRLHPEVLGFLASMISEGRLIAKPRGRGRRLPSKNTRDYMAALLVSYSATRTADGGFTITVCQDKAGCDESIRAARDWVAKNAANTGASAPTISEGTVMWHLR